MSYTKEDLIYVLKKHKMWQKQMHFSSIWKQTDLWDIKPFKLLKYFMSTDISVILHTSIIDFIWFNSVILLELPFSSMFLSFDLVLPLMRRKMFSIWVEEQYLLEKIFFKILEISEHFFSILKILLYISSLFLLFAIILLKHFCSFSDKMLF